jgi:hypothetical protein
MPLESKATPTQPVIGQDNNVNFNWGVKIPLRDRIQLNATVYRPDDSQPVPAIFTLTPYISDTYHARACYFAQHGYAFLLVDCRGRGNSEGEFYPFVNEPQDAVDIVTWLSEQPWCEGSVSMWGGSYAGFDQWMALKGSPEALKTIVPAASAHVGVDFPFYKNIFFSYEIQWLTFISGVTPNNNLFGDQPFWIAKFQQRFRKHVPFKDLDQLAGNSSTHFQIWMEHPTPDLYWQSLALTPEEYRRIDIPILSITGHYDDDQPGAMHFYRMHMLHGTEQATANHFLIIGPWDHAGTRTPTEGFGGLKFSLASLLDLNNLHREWYDWTLKAGSRPEFLKERVAYYVTGLEQWKYASSLEKIASRTRLLYLNSRDGQANDSFHSGSLEEASPALDSSPDHYVYDPLDLRPAELETEPVLNFLTDQRYVLNTFGNGLVYHSAPFEQEVEISGFVRLELWICLDVPDTDFSATLFEILRDGSSIQLAQDLLRARYRHSLKQETLVTPGEIERYTFDGFYFFSRRISRGSRLRLFINSPNTIFVQKNYNSGGAVISETAADAHTAHIMLYHDAEHPSYLQIPLVD